MSTIEDFENAPVGAIATSPNGNTAFKTGRRTLEWFIFSSRGRLYDTLCSDEMVGYTLNTAAPTTAREALTLAWELAHPVKEGQVIPAGTETIVRSDEILLMTPQRWDRVVEPGHAENFRTFDPLPDPEPDWLNAPAVMAVCNDSMDRAVFVRENESGTQWVRDTRFYRWDELTDVTPLYLKETEQDEWCRAEHCTWRHWRSGSVPTHKRGADCPREEKGQDA